jgi:predicted amidohydrolase
MKLTVATCQFPITSDIDRNFGYVSRQLRAAQRQGAELVHFSEACLGGYVGVDIPSFEDYPWDRLLRRTRETLDLVRRLKMWVILGSNHRLSGRRKPHNSLYLINPQGEIVDRYDKMFLCGDRIGKTYDLCHYSPGSKFVVFKVKGIRCGLQICHDFRYPELYRELKKKRVQLVFHSYHNGGMSPEKIRKAQHVWKVMVKATMQAYAASNYMWISVNNTTRRESSGSSFLVRPDGLIHAALPHHRADVMTSTIDTEAEYYDASKEWRSRALRGIYHSGTLVRDPRSEDRKSL